MSSRSLVSHCCVLLLSTAALYGQSQRGQIVGRVTDKSGSSVPSATVEVWHLDTSIRTPAQTNAEGLYSIPYLQYGRYRVAVTASGFAPYRVSDVEVAVATSTTVNAVLAVGGVSEQVEVSASAVVLETSTSTVGTSVDEKLKTDLPNLVGTGIRSAYNYVTLMPGVTVTRDTSYSIGGGRINGNDALIDGQTKENQAANMGDGDGGMPAVETIGEAKMMTNSLAAEYGRSSGGLATFATKSGTGQFHGVLYEYFRNYALDARPWAAALRDLTHRNEFGIAGGGPLIVPKIYNGRNKTFFWANATGYIRHTLASTSILTVPTPATRNGDFSASDLNSIYDTTQLSTNSGGQTIRQQFSYGGRLNVMDPNRISKVSKYFLNLIPLPNIAGARSSNNYIGTQNDTRNRGEASVKVDHYVSATSRVSGYLQYSYPLSTTGSVLGTPFQKNGLGPITRPRLEWTYNLSPNLIHQAMYGFTKYGPNYSTYENYGQEIGRAAGLTGTFDANCPSVGLTFTICSGNPNDHRLGLVQTFNDSLLWNRGAHTFKFGFQLIRWRENYHNTGSQYSATGTYSFSDSTTGQTTGGGGSLWASFLLGWPSSAGVSSPVDFGVRQTYYAAFVQDDWKISRRLTINAGLRWDINVPYSEQNGRITGVDLTLPNPGAGNLPGALTFYGSGPGRNGRSRPGEVHWKNLGPRLGLAWQIDNRTVLRAFGGLIYQGIQNTNGQSADRSGFFASGSPSPNTSPYAVYYSWDTPFPQNVLGVVPNTDPAFRNGQSVTFQRESGIGRAPVLYQWSASLQRELKASILLEASYVANAMHYGNDRMSLTQLAPKYWSLGPLLNTSFNGAAVQALGYTAPYPGFASSLPLYRALQPYPQFSGLTDGANPWTSSSYNAGIFKIQKRFSSGLTLLAHYTVSKTISNNGSSSPGVNGALPRDAYNLGLSRALAPFDIPQRLLMTYSYELPFGPGKPLLGGPGMWRKVIIGGWSISGLQQYQSGPPVQVTGALATAIPTVNSTSDRVLDVPVRSSLACSSMAFGNPAKNYLLNSGNPTQAARTGVPLAYQSEGNYGIGNAPIVDPHARQCGTADEALGLSKTFAVHERLRIRFTAEAFNLLNRHTWATATSQSVTSASFGTTTPYQIAGPRQMQLNLRIQF